MKLRQMRRSRIFLSVNVGFSLVHYIFLSFIHVLFTSTPSCRVSVVKRSEYIAIRECNIDIFLSKQITTTTTQ